MSLSTSSQYLCVYSGPTVVESTCFQQKAVGASCTAYYARGSFTPLYNGVCQAGSGCQNGICVAEYDPSGALPTLGASCTSNGNHIPVCDANLECINGRCAAPCTSTSCPAGQNCVNMVCTQGPAQCRPPCATPMQCFSTTCRLAQPGEACQATANCAPQPMLSDSWDGLSSSQLYPVSCTGGKCTGQYCATATDCPSGQLCLHGLCLAACTASSCPAGNVCANQRCVPAVSASACNPACTSPLQCFGGTCRYAMIDEQCTSNAQCMPYMLPELSLVIQGKSSGPTFRCINSVCAYG